MPVILDNPVIDSYVKGIQMRRQQEQTEFERNIATQQQKNAQEQLKGYLAHLKAEEEHQAAGIDIQRQQLALQSKAHALNAQQQLAQMISSGLYHPSIKPAGPTQSAPANASPVPGMEGPEQNSTQFQNPLNQQVDVPGVGPVRLGDYATPQEMLNRKLSEASAMGQVQANTAGLTRTAQNKADEPFQINAEQRANKYKTDFAALEQRNKLEQIGAEGKNRLAETKERNAGGIQEANIRANAERDAARIRMFGGVDNPDDWEKIITPYVYGEASKPLGNDPRSQVIRQHLGDAIPGAVEVTNKQTNELRGNIRTNDIYDEMRGIIDKLPTSKVNAAGQHVLAKLPATDAANLDRQVNGLSLKYLKSTGTFAARAVQTELDKIKGVLGGGTGMTKEQALSNLELGRRNTSNDLLDATLSNVPEQQKLELLLHNHVDPKVYTMKGSDGKTYPRYSQNPNDPNKWGVFDPKTLSYQTVGVQ